MTISTEVNRLDFAGDGATTAFPTSPMVFFDDTDLVVYVTDNTTGAETLLNLNSTYSVSGGSGSTGTVDLSGGSAPYGAPASGTTLTILRELALTQSDHFVNGDDNDAAVQETALDRLTLFAQQLKEILARCVQFPPGETPGNTLDPFATRANTVLGFDANGDLFAFTAIPTGTVASAFMQNTVFPAATALAARQVLDIDTRATTIASAATLDLDSIAGDYVNVSGSVGITAITLSDGLEKTVRFTGAPLITNGASLTLPGSANLQIVAGDVAKFRGDSGGVVRLVAFVPNEQGVLSKLPTAKGDILIATAARTVARKAVGTDGYSLIPSSGATDGTAWVGPSSYAILNGSLTASVGASALTVALKGVDGNDPSATNPVFVVFRSSSAGTGTPAIIKVTAATSFTISSGSTLGTSNNISFRFWIVGFNDAGTFRLGAVNCLSGTNIFALRDNIITNSTAEGGAGAADSAQVIYTGTAVTAKAMRVLGYVDYAGGIATAGTYASAPTLVQLYGPGVSLPGLPVQQVYTATGAVATGSTVIPNDDTIPQNTEGDQYMSLAITPTATPNVLEVEAQVHIANSAGGAASGMALFQDATANALAATRSQLPSVDIAMPNKLLYRFMGNTTSATTLKIRAGSNNAGTTTFNGTATARVYGGVLSSYLKITELMA